MNFSIHANAFADNNNPLRFGRRVPLKYLLIMKLIVLLTIGFCIQASADALGQQITLSAKEASFKTVLQSVQRQSGYSFMITNALMEQAQPVTINVRSEEIEKVLPILFKGQPFTYEVNGKLIKVLPKVNPQIPAIPLNSAQQTIRGRVTDSLGNPLQGVTVQVKESGWQTITDREGRYEITGVYPTETLHFRLLSYEPYETQANRPEINVVLRFYNSLLDEPVVIGYGVTSKRLNTGSVGTVGAQQIGMQPVSNPLAALHGRIPGLFVAQSNGLPGSNINIAIRGRNSIGSGNEPLFVIDGVPFALNSLSQIPGANLSQSPFNSLNPHDIESITVLKDADATAIYGSRGANGVILITTKKSSIGKVNFDVNAFTGIGEVTSTMELMNTSQYLAMRREAYSNDGIEPNLTNAADLLVWDTTRYTDWKNLLIGNTAHYNNIQLGISGGSELVQLRLSGGYNAESTVFPGNFGDKRGSIHLNLRHGDNNSKFKAALTANYSLDRINLIPTDLTLNITAAPHQPAYGIDGNPQWTDNGVNIFNPLGQLQQRSRTVTNNLVSNGRFSYSILPELTTTVNLGYTNTRLDEARIYPKASFAPTRTASGLSDFASRSFISWIIEPQIEFSKDTGIGVFTFLVGASRQQETINGHVINASNYSNEALLESTTGAGTITASTNYSLYRYQSVFGRVNYNYANKYLLNITGRRDGSSRFGPGKQYATFGAIGAAWLFSEESFIKEKLPFISLGKIRASYGVTGNDRIGNYQFLDTYSNAMYPYQNLAGLIPTRLSNPDYGWEVNKKMEGAMELGFIRDRVLLSVAHFRNRSDSQLLNYTLPVQTGFPGIVRNLPALVENRGWEVELNTVNISKPTVNWTTSFNLTIARNELLEFPGLESSSYANNYEIGHPLTIRKLFPFLGVNPETGLYEVDMEGERSIADLTPTVYGGISNGVQFRGFQLDVFFQFVKSQATNYIATISGAPGLIGINQPALLLEDRWRQNGEIAAVQRFTTGGVASSAFSNYRNSEGAFTDASFIRLKNIQIAYNLPRKWLTLLGLESSRIYMQGQNLFTLTAYEGNDPEVPSFYSLPPLKVITVGVQLNF